LRVESVHWLLAIGYWLLANIQSFSHSVIQSFPPKPPLLAIFRNVLVVVRTMTTFVPATKATLSMIGFRHDQKSILVEIVILIVVLMLHLCSTMLRS